MRIKRYKKELMIGGAFLAVLVILIVISVTLMPSVSDDPLNSVTGKSVASVKKVADKSTEALKKSVEKIKTVGECKANICYRDQKEYYCTKSFVDCSIEYDDQCRIVWCEKDEPKVKVNPRTEYQVQETDGENLSSGCVEEYNDCYDGDEEIVCHGSYDECINVFVDCSCGTAGDDYKADTNTINFKKDSDKISAEKGDCASGNYLCKKTSMSMSGDIVTSEVECKSSYADCASRYGDCNCANLTTSWFTTEESVCENPCDWDGHIVECERLEGECEATKHLCDKGTGALITCEGTLEYCKGRYNDLCVCGIEPVQ